MPDCCDPESYGRMFDGSEARRRLRNYRRRGLDGMATKLVGYLTERGVVDKTVLEVGGGVGDLQVELLKAGASNCVNVELSPAYEESAIELMESEGLTDRMDRVVGDFVEQQDLVDIADVVVLNRVICCYPWMDRMMDAALGRTGWILALSVPRDGRLGTLCAALENWYFRLRSCGFRGYLHPVAEIESRAIDSGMSPVFSHSGVVWQAMVFERLS